MYEYANLFFSKNFNINLNPTFYLIKEITLKKR